MSKEGISSGTSKAAKADKTTCEVCGNVTVVKIGVVKMSPSRPIGECDTCKTKHVGGEAIYVDFDDWKKRQTTSLRRGVMSFNAVGRKRGYGHHAGKFGEPLPLAK